ncbi:THUMP domain-containing protein [Rhizobium leguminosarum]|uniref:THUMP domain-containing protein n=1 Tax=Rhizobium leguminosarum TaxID=384 RepID=UPI003D7C1590
MLNGFASPIPRENWLPRFASFSIGADRRGCPLLIDTPMLRNILATRMRQPVPGARLHVDW